MKCSDCGTYIKPVVAIDIDGTLGDYHRHLLDFMEDYFDRGLPRFWSGRGDWEDHLRLNRFDYQEAKLAFRQGGFKRWMPVFPGASRLTHNLVESGIEVWLTTTRPYLRHDSVDPDTREWLRRNHIKWDHLLYDESKYHKLASLVDPSRVIAVLEDLPDQYDKAMREFGNRALLIARPHNEFFRSYRRGVETVGSLEEAGLKIYDSLGKWITENA